LRILGLIENLFNRESSLVEINSRETLANFSSFVINKFASTLKTEAKWIASGSFNLRPNFSLNSLVLIQILQLDEIIVKLFVIKILQDLLVE